MAGSVCPARARPSVAIKRDCFDRPSPPRTSPVFPSETRRKTCRKPPKTPGASGFGMDWGVGSRVQPISIARDLDPRARRLTPPASGPPPRAHAHARNPKEALAGSPAPSVCARASRLSVHRPPPASGSHPSEPCLGARVPIRGHDPKGTSRHPPDSLQAGGSLLFAKPPASGPPSRARAREGP